MGKAHRPGGIYRNQSGQGFHNANGQPIPLTEIPQELLTEEERASLTPDEPQETPEASPAGPQLVHKEAAGAEGDDGTQEGQEADQGPDGAPEGTEGQEEGSEGGQGGDIAEPEELDDDFPGATYFRAAKVTTYADVAAHPDILTIDGVGPKTAKQALAHPKVKALQAG